MQSNFAMIVPRREQECSGAEMHRTSFGTQNNLSFCKLGVLYSVHIYQASNVNLQQQHVAQKGALGLGLS